MRALHPCHLAIGGLQRVMSVFNPTHTAILPSVLAMDDGYLAESVAAAVAGGANALHCDIMDGHFVPNISFGPKLVASLKTLSALPLDVHLMVSTPQNFIPIFAKIGVQSMAVHAELPHNQLQAALRQIKALGCQAGLALNPATALTDVPDAVWPLLDRLLIMTVQPGFGGQDFLDMSAKIAAAKLAHPTLIIQVDGGINPATAAIAVKAGATELVVGSYLYDKGIAQVGAQMAALQQSLARL